MKTYSTIIAGSRTIEQIEQIERAVTESGFIITEVVSGGQVSRDATTGDLYGADYLGEQWAKRHMIPIRRFAADWRKHGKAAGPIRNDEMARYADQLIAVWDGQSRGTRDMIDRAERYGLKVYVHRV